MLILTEHLSTTDNMNVVLSSFFINIVCFKIKHYFDKTRIFSFSSNTI